VAVVFAEQLGGTEAAFTRRMTDRARELGMRNTTFRTANGLTAEGQRSTARDMAILVAHILRNHPDRMHYFSTRTFTYGGNTYTNSNRMLGAYAGMDGMKTGYTQAAGYNLATTAERNGRRLIVVVFGGRSGRGRNAHVADLLDWGFDRANQTLYARHPLPPRIPGEGVPRVLAAAQPEPAFEGSRPNAPVPPRRPGGYIQLAEGASDEDSQPVPPADRLSDIVLTNVQDLDLRGTYSIQIGAFSSEQSSRAAIDTVRAGAPQGLVAAPAAVIATSSGGSTLYRSRFLGFDRVTALSLCQALRQRSRGCLVVAED